MKQSEIRRIALRAIAWTALDGFRRDHQGAQGIIGDTEFDEIDKERDCERVVDAVVALLRKFGCDDNEALLRIRKDELREIADHFADIEEEK